MSKFAALLLVVLFVVAGCVPAPQLSVNLASPSNGSFVPSLSPVLAWDSAGGATSYRLQVASDSNFQSLVVDASNLGEPLYTVPSGTLSNNVTYYWRVIGSRGGTSSGWSAAWSFSTPGGAPQPSAAGNVYISATLDGSPWSGAANFAVYGPFSDTENAMPKNFSNVPTGTYTIIYNYGGPSGASVASITPSPTQVLAAGGSIYFTLNFHRQTTSSIDVFALLDGAPWSGTVNYSITGPFNDSEYSTPKTLTNLPQGTYTLTYMSGGPVGAALNAISPSPTEILGAGSSTSFTLIFKSRQASNVVVNATLNGVSWSGGVSYTLSGPINEFNTLVPATLPNVPAGTYTLTYTGGGPTGASLVSITPAPSQVLAGGRTIVFNMNFVEQQRHGTIMVNATLDGQPWRVMPGSGSVSYTVVGPKTDSSNTVPETFRDMPAGAYTFTFNSGGPPGATLANITPSPLQNLSPGGVIAYAMNFQGQPRGTITVHATLDGAPWSGEMSYVVQGPYVQSGYATPETFTGAPTGSYSVQYRAGGPPSSVFEGVFPSTQIMPAGGNIAFTLRFRFQGVKPQPMPGPVPRPEPMPGPLKGLEAP